MIHEDAAASHPWRQVANGDRIASMELTPDSGAPSSSTISGWLQWQVASELLAGSGVDLRQLKIGADGS